MDLVRSTELPFVVRAFNPLRGAVGGLHGLVFVLFRRRHLEEEVLNESRKAEHVTNRMSGWTLRAANIGGSGISK
jgi:hypothetical protein